MKIKANGQLYPFPEKPTSIGEARIIKKEYGVVFGRDEFDMFDPDWAAALLYRAMREADPALTPKLAIAAVNEVTEVDFVGDDGAELTGEEDEVPPTRPDAETPATGD